MKTESEEMCTFAQSNSDDKVTVTKALRLSALTWWFYRAGALVGYRTKFFSVS